MCSTSAPVSDETCSLGWSVLYSIFFFFFFSFFRITPSQIKILAVCCGAVRSSGGFCRTHCLIDCPRRIGLTWQMCVEKREIGFEVGNAVVIPYLHFFLLVSFLLLGNGVSRDALMHVI